MAKEKFTIDFPMKSVPVLLLWNYISTSNGLEQWFADEVKHIGKDYIFTWNGSEQEAALLGTRANNYIRFRWKDDNDRGYFEFKIQVSELTDATELVITDFAEEDEIDDQIALWNSQVEGLQRILGCL